MTNANMQTGVTSEIDSIAPTTSRRVLIGAALAGAVTLARPGWSAAQPEGGVAIFPPQDTWTASPATEISFRGVTAEELGPVTVVASHSGGHSGVMRAHADGNGVSFVPDARFDPGEMVTVTAGIPLSGEDGAHTFGVVRPADLTPAPDGRESDDPETEPLTFRSRPDLLPPAMEITTPASGTADGYVFLSSNVPNGQIGLTILDNDGDYIWFQPPETAIDSIYDFRAQEYQGQPVLTWVEGASPVGYAFAHFVIADSAYQPLVELQVGNGFPGGDVHEFRLTDRGTALVILYHPVEWDLSPVGGSRYARVIDNIVQELEVETGRVLFEWHSLDHIAVDESMRKYNPSAVGAVFNDPFDYFHLNSIAEAPDGDLIISARHSFGVYKIAYPTGEVVWRLNGNRSDFEMGEGTPFAWQHDAQLFPDGVLTLFDNAESNQDLDGTVASRGLVLQLDEAAMTATLAQEYIHPTEILSTSQANMQTLPNGNRFIGWGSAPVFSEFTDAGELIFNGRFPKGGNSYRAYRMPWVGEPVEPPAIAAETSAAGSLTVYASWNGATEVASWRVLGGESEADLAEVGSAARAGFETEIPVDTLVTFVAVEALDASGNILGASEVIQPGA